MTTTIIKQASPAKVSNHIGTIGDRVRIEGVIRHMFGGRPMMHIVEDFEGNQFVVRTPNVLGSKPGVLVTIRGTVAGHRTYREIKQTELTAIAEEIVTEQHAFRQSR